jgi:hypothetical protein
VAAQAFSFFMGLIFLAGGICGFIPRLLTRPPDRLDWGHMALRMGYGFEFGFLPTNLLHNLLYLAIGAGGVLAVVSFRMARGYCKGLCALALLLVFVGFAPWGIDNVWGILPLFGWNVLWHTVVAVLAWYFGFIYDPDDVELSALVERT